MEQTRRQELALRAEELRRNMTFAEKRLWYNFLQEYPVPFVAQKIIGNYIVDFYCKKAHLSIEIDGESHFTEHQRKYDEIRTTYLEMLGIKELRFTNNEIRFEFEGVCEEIDREIIARRNDCVGNSFQRLLRKK